MMVNVAREPGSEDHDRPLATDDPVFSVPDIMSFAIAGMLEKRLNGDCLLGWSIDGTLTYTLNPPSSS